MAANSADNTLARVEMETAAAGAVGVCVLRRRTPGLFNLSITIH